MIGLVTIIFKREPHERQLAIKVVTLFEAAQISRLTPERLAITPAKARNQREDLLRTHLLAHGSEARLRSSVNELLSKETAPTANLKENDLGVGLVDDLVELDPYDSRHLFWEELRQIAFALRDVTPEDIDEKILDDFLSASDQLSGVLARVEKRRQQHATL